MTDTPAPATAIDAVARVLHDLDCDDDAGKCARWLCGIDPGNRHHRHHVGHVDFYRRRASSALTAAMPHLICCKYDGCDCRAAGVAAERQRIRPALEDALEGLREMLPYCGDYFRDKWQLDAYVERAERAMADLLDDGGQDT